MDEKILLEKILSKKGYYKELGFSFVVWRQWKMKHKQGTLSEKVAAKILKRAGYIIAISRKWSKAK